jgi:hypothetical protein
MNRLLPAMLVALVLACTIVVDNDEPLSTSFGEETAQEETSEPRYDLPPTLSACSDQGFRVVFLVDGWDCPEGFLKRCEIGSHKDPFAQATICCDSESSTATCEGAFPGVSGNTQTNPECPDGLIEICDAW